MYLTDILIVIHRINIHTDIRTLLDKQTDRWSEEQKDRLTEKKIDKIQTGGQRNTNTEKDKQTDRRQGDKR